MNPITLTIAIKGLIGLAIVVGAILALRYGYKLYREGIGEKRDDYAFEFGAFKLKANSVGSVVMATAFLWAWLAVAVSPNLNKSGDTVRVYSFETSSGVVTSRTVAAKLPSDTAKPSPAELTGLFRSAVASAEATETGAVVTLAGQPASIDVDSLKTTVGTTGTVLLSADVHAGVESASVVFDPQVSKDKVMFVPAEATDGQAAAAAAISEKATDGM